jgi:hypothetical protein
MNHSVFSAILLAFVTVGPMALAQDDPMKERERQPQNRNDSTLRPNWDVYKPSGNTPRTRRRPNQYDGNFRVGGGLQLGFPQGQFQEVAPDLRPWGLAFSGLGRLGRSPLWLGADVALVRYGRQVDVNSIWGGSRVVRKNRLIMGHLVARLQPSIDFPIQPYVEGMAGLKYFRTNTTVETNRGNNNNNNSFTAPNYEDVAFSYGGAGGLNIMLSPNVGIDLKVIYTLGGTATYVKPEDMTVGPDPAQTVINRTTRSSTDLISGQVGVVINF